MKKLGIVFTGLLVFVALNFSAQVSYAEPLEVTDVVYDEEADVIRVEFQTVAVHSSSCYLRTSTLTMNSPHPLIEGELEVGYIRIVASVPPGAMCRMTFGHHKGSIEFEPGRKLPKLPEGLYRIYVNGENKGLLNWIDEDEELFEFENDE